MKPLHMIGLVIGALASGFFIISVSLDILANPGGITGVMLLLAWLAVPFVLTVLAITSPRSAYPVLVVVVCIALVLALTSIFLADAVWAYESRNGPADLMVLVGTLAPLVALGKAMPGKAGQLLIVASLGLLVLLSLSLLFAGEADKILGLVATVLPFLLSGLLFGRVGRQEEVAELAQNLAR